MSPIQQLASAVNAARQHVEQCRAAYNSKQAEVRTSLTLEEVFFDRPDLLDLYRRHQEVSRLTREYAALQERAQQEKLRLLDELRSRQLERIREGGGDEFRQLKEERDYLSWLLREIRPGDDLANLLANPRLRQTHRTDIARALASQNRENALAYLKDLLRDKMRRTCESYDRLSRQVSDAELEPLIKLPLEPFLNEVENVRARLEAVRSVKAALARAEELRASRERELLEQRTRQEWNNLQQAEAALEQAQAALCRANQKAAEERAREEQETKWRAQEERHRLEQEWCAGMLNRPLSELLPLLPGLTGQRAEAVLERLLQMQMNDPHLHHPQVQEFLRRECHHRAGSAALLSPAFIALLGRLSLQAPDKARRLRAMLPEVAGELALVVGYFDFVRDDGPVLTGVTRFDSLAEEDLYLAACYWEQHPEHWARIKDWDYGAVEASFVEAFGGGESEAINSFKVCGLQPRIAELAFRDVCLNLSGPQEAGFLTDLNVRFVGRLPRPWLWTPGDELPGADWQDQKGNQYDVKCNLYFRSRRAKEGLRGLLIQFKTRSDENHYYPGFVFFDSNAEECSWCYIGTYRHKDEVRGGRVSPFLFRLPKRCRFETQATDTAEHLLADWPLRVGWHLAARTTPNSPFDNQLISEVVSRCAKRSGDMPLEEALWKYITEAVLDGCSALEPHCVDDFLTLAEELICSGALPLRLPSVNGDPLLLRWIRDILRPIANNWGKIRCPSCSRLGNEPRVIRLSEILMTSEGSIEAHFTCLACGFQRASVRVLTHCHGCGQYPLLLGVNPVCGGCAGLVCFGKRANGASCHRCKHDDCPSFKSRQENHVATSDRALPNSMVS